MPTLSSRPAPLRPTPTADATRAFWCFYTALLSSPAPFDSAATRRQLEGFAAADDVEDLLAFIAGNSLTSAAGKHMPF